LPSILKIRPHTGSIDTGISAMSECSEKTKPLNRYWDRVKNGWDIN